MAVADIEHRTWGEWPSLRLTTAAASVEVVGEVGARIVSLRDEQRNREWLLQGAPPTELEQMEWATEVAVFGGRESFGWDECFPTTTPCPDPVAPDSTEMRDHGDQWGRGAYLSIDPEEGTVVHTWSVPRWQYRLSRQLSFEDPTTLLVRYVAVSHARNALPVSWAAHPVLALEPGSLIDLAEVHSARSSWRNGIGLAPDLAWPRATLEGGDEIDLSRIRGGDGWAAVLYAEPPGRVEARTPDGARLALDWDRAFAPTLRVWQSYGGWPVDGEPREQVALEPCTSEHDDLASAVAAGDARTLEPGGELRWWLRVRVGGEAASPDGGAA